MKKIRTLIWGFNYKVGNEIIESLKKEIDVKYVISDAHISDVDELKFIFNPGSLNFKNEKIKNFELDEYYKFKKENFFIFNLTMAIRGGDYNDIGEVNNEFYILYSFFSKILDEKKIDIVIFSAPPHQGPDYILYKIAKKKNLKTVICSGSCLANKFFIFSNLDDWGLFSKYPKINDNNEIPEFDKYTSNIKDLVYSYEEKWKKKNSFFISIKLKLMNFLLYLNVIKRPHYELQSEYLKNLKNYTINDKEFEKLFYQNKKIALFPLHYEPEAATNILGNEFHDQVLAIETLSRLLNNNWIILIKEHRDPPQSYKFRRNLFFERIKKIKNLYFISKDYDLMDIIKKVDLISTISGTAGWEAVNLKKKCLVFGNAWYQEVYGCTKYHSKLTHENLIDELNKPFNKLDFDKNIIELSKRLGEGIVDEYFVKMINKFDYLKNAKNVTNSIIKFIDKTNKIDQF